MPIALEPIVASHIAAFNEGRLGKIEDLRVAQLLRRKNPYLFIARRTVTPQELADELVRASLSSSEETMFGQTLEDIAIDICSVAFGGWKSTASGIDLEFVRDGVRFIVAIKSGPSWGNSSQIDKMRADFRRAIQVVRQGNPNLAVQAINGCCYGRASSDKGDYRKVCGAAFWELISGEPDLFARLVPALTEAAANGYATQVAALTASVAAELERNWCTDDGMLDWTKIVAANSQAG